MQRFHSSHSCNFLVGKSSTEVSLRHFFAGGCAWLQHRALRLQRPRVGWSRVFWQALLAGEQAQEPVGCAINKTRRIIWAQEITKIGKCQSTNSLLTQCSFKHSDFKGERMTLTSMVAIGMIFTFIHCNYPDCFWTHMQSGKPRPSVTQFNSSWLDKKEADTCWVSEYVFGP